MKKIMLLTIFISSAISRSIYSQNDTLIDFENINTMIEIDTSDTNNIWQIGQPSKLDFNSAYSSTKSIITDSINSYPINCNSQFILKINSKYLNHQGIKVSFWHKYETDSKNDYGTIEYSLNGGINWKTLKDTMYQETGGLGYWWNSDSANSKSWTENLPMTGSSSGWILSEYWWAWYIPSKIDCNIDDSESNLKNAVEIVPDSIYFRFLFVSDSIADSKSGWIIDNIKIEEIVITNISDNNKENDIIIFPNPTSELITIQLPVDLSFGTYTLCNIDGQKLLENKLFDRLIKLKVTEYKKGIYFIMFHGKGKPITKTIIIN